jgi:hypothetical protein
VPLLEEYGGIGVIMEKDNGLQLIKRGWGASYMKIEYTGETGK